MARVQDVDPNTVTPQIRAVLETQAKKWGGPLLNHLIYARRPSIFKGVRMMWSGLDASGLIDPRLVAMINRRVAFLNGCEFCQVINAAVGSGLGIADEKVVALTDWESSPLFDDVERLVLEYADAMPFAGREVSDEL